MKTREIFLNISVRILINTHISSDAYESFRWDKWVILTSAFLTALWSDCFLWRFSVYKPLAYVLFNKCTTIKTALWFKKRPREIFVALALPSFSLLSEIYEQEPPAVCDFFCLLHDFDFRLTASPYRKFKMLLGIFYLQDGSWRLFVPNKWSLPSIIKWAERENVGMVRSWPKGGPAYGGDE